jgi:hypothetical protein
VLAHLFLDVLKLIIIKIVEVHIVNSSLHSTLEPSVTSSLLGPNVILSTCWAEWYWDRISCEHTRTPVNIQ